jgi:SAM-dependent methyltransferase
MTPRGGPGKSVLEMGCYMQVTPPLSFLLGYEDVRGCYLGKLGITDSKTVVAPDGRQFHCYIDLFDAEKDVYPYPDARFDTVLCCELLEHLFSDPMHMMAELNRILKPGGYLVLTTPNITNLRALHALLLAYHPGFFHTYAMTELLRQRGLSLELREDCLYTIGRKTGPVVDRWPRGLYES